MKTITRRDWWTIGGVGVVAAAAVIASFTAQAGLGHLAGWDAALALPGGIEISLSWLLPLCVDAYGAVATRITVNAKYSAETRRHALIHAVGAVVVSIIGNAIYHALEAGVLHLGSSRWVLVVAVSMVPPVALGALAHLMALCARDDTHAKPAPAEPAPAPTPTRTEDFSRPTEVPAPVWQESVRVDDTDRAPYAARTAGTGAAPRAVAAARTARTEVVALATVRADRTAKQDATPARTPDRTERADRTAFVAELARQIRTAEADGSRWEPDYDDLEARSGYRRSWCEKAVRDARALAAHALPTTPEPLTSSTHDAHTRDADEHAGHGAGDSEVAR
ncbi:hypothetical protein [Nonomuraea ceibae]|uniref:hypothetical protein n=1 Tax=Nonomuraea ceibae TaxID=1935170 RepID=UPI001C5E240B|nr:hypothetical protein [Nonomuraea ceibae]